LVIIDELFQRVVKLSKNIEGISVSGGEPLQQFQPLLAFLKRIRKKTNLSVIVFTGYTLKEIQQMQGTSELLECIDLLIAGRYDKTRRIGKDLRGSANQHLHFLSDRYTEDDVKTAPPAEVLIAKNGQVTVTGIDPPDLNTL